jgi:3-hydroxyacyl-CoA dehydrogenase
MVDTSDEALKKGKAIITSSLARIAKKKPGLEGDEKLQKAFVDDVFSRISLSTNASSAVKDSDLVVEVKNDFSPLSIRAYRTQLTQKLTVLKGHC